MCSVAENKRAACLDGGITGEWRSYHPISYEAFSTIVSMPSLTPGSVELVQW